jgi:hypothetical protein
MELGLKVSVLGAHGGPCGGDQIDRSTLAGPSSSRPVLLNYFERTPPAESTNLTERIYSAIRALVTVELWIASGRQMDASSELAGNTQIPLPFALGGIGLVLAWIFPSFLSGGTSFLVGFAAGLAILFGVGYYEGLHRSVMREGRQTPQEKSDAHTLQSVTSTQSELVAVMGDLAKSLEETRKLIQKMRIGS